MKVMRGMGMLFGAYALGVALLSGVAMSAPPVQSGGCRLEGQVIGAGRNGFAGLMIEVGASSSDQHSTRSFVDQMGGFHIDDLPAGDYEVRLTSQYGGLVSKQYVTLREQTTRLSFNLPAPASPAVPASGSVSVERLRHNVPAKAHKAWRKAAAALERGQVREAIRFLEKAIAIDPEYADAYINLAACHATLHDFDRALPYARKAAALDPASLQAKLNLSHTLTYLHDYAGAEAAARDAVRLNATLPMAHFLLGIALKGEGRNDEALVHFERAAAGVPLARLQAADLLARRGLKAEAAGQLRGYLRSGEAANRGAVETWLARLQM